MFKLLVYLLFLSSLSCSSLNGQISARNSIQNHEIDFDGFIIFGDIEDDESAIESPSPKRQKTSEDLAPILAEIGSECFTEQPLLETSNELAQAQIQRIYSAMKANDQTAFEEVVLAEKFDYRIPVFGQIPLLHGFVKVNNIGAVCALIEKGHFPVNHEALIGGFFVPPLAYSRTPEMTAFLIENGANVNQYICKEGAIRYFPILHIFVALRLTEIVEILLKAGANPYARDSQLNDSLKIAKFDYSLVVLNTILNFIASKFRNK